MRQNSLLVVAALVLLFTFPGCDKSAKVDADQLNADKLSARKETRKKPAKKSAKAESKEPTGPTASSLPPSKALLDEATRDPITR